MAEPAPEARGNWEAEQMCAPPSKQNKTRVCECEAPRCWRALRAAPRRLDVYVLDYLRKRRMLQTAASFQSEAKLAEAPVGAPWLPGARGRWVLCWR
jgi:hypothetical protein